MENQDYKINIRFKQLDSILKWYNLDIEEFMYMGEESNISELNSICVTYVRFKHSDTRDYLYLIIDNFDRKVVQVPCYPDKHFKHGSFLKPGHLNLIQTRESKTNPNGVVHILRG